MTKKKSKKKEPPVQGTLLICVGCGGIFYHGLTRMSVWVQKRDGAKVLLIDPDKIEAKNRTRQWGSGIGHYKVCVAREALVLGLGLDEKKIYTYQGRAIPTLFHPDILEESSDGELLEDIGRVVVVATPDNHLCRKEVHEGCVTLAMKSGLPVYEITAGNDMEGGYAYGCVHHREETKVASDGKGTSRTVVVKCDGDWVLRHPDIIKEAELEAQRLAEPMPCGEMEEEVLQSAVTNSMTAGCVWDLAEMMMSGGMVGEALWNLCTDGENRYRKIWGKLQVISALGTPMTCSSIDV